MSDVGSAGKPSVYRSWLSATQTAGAAHETLPSSKAAGPPLEPVFTSIPLSCQADPFQTNRFPSLSETKHQVFVGHETEWG